MRKHILAFALILSSASLTAETESTETMATDINTFLKMSNDIAKIRESRLVSIDEFNKMSADPDTLIIDSRSASAFKDAHIKGAININFSDFTKEKLAKVIPNKNTRILIYCNNNFISKRTSLISKRIPLALNIPTFINLHGYGYENVYELKDRIPDTHKQVNLVTNDKAQVKSE